MNNNNKLTAGALYNTGPNYNSSSNPQTSNITKFSTLSPYLTEIQKRKKAKSVLNKQRQLYRKGLNNHKRKRNGHSKHESSSKSFRIKQKSSTSLHLHLHGRENNTVINIIGKLQSKQHSMDKHQQCEYKNNIKNNIDLSKQSSYYEEQKEQDVSEDRIHNRVALQKNRKQKDGRSANRRQKIMSQPYSSHTIRLQSNQNSHSRNKNMEQHLNKRVVISRNSEPNTITMNLQTIEKKENKIYPSKVANKEQDIGTNKKIERNKKQKSFRKGMYENHHNFLINNIKQQTDQNKETPYEIKNIDQILIKDNQISENRRKIDQQKEKGYKKLKFHKNTNNSKQLNQYTKQSYTIDSYRNKSKNLKNHNSSFYDKNKKNKHARCDSALVMQERERQDIVSITKTTDLKEKNIKFGDKGADNGHSHGQGKKFRKNKYEQMYSSVTSNDMDGDINNRVYASTSGAVRPNISSESRKTQPKNHHNEGHCEEQNMDIDVNKSDSRTVKMSRNACDNNSHVIWSNNNMQMDIQAEKDIKKFYRNMGSKQLKRSVEKQIQKYFKDPHNKEYPQTNSSRWIPKTNNDIEIYISTIKPPNIHTNDKSQQKSSNIDGNKTDQLFEYEFEFKQQLLLVNNSSVHNGKAKKNVIKDRGMTIDVHDQDSSNFNQESYYQDSMGQDHKLLDHYLQKKSECDEQLEYEYEIELQEEGSFEKQRKEVEKKYFYKQGPPQIQWSDEDCQIDQSN